MRGKEWRCKLTTSCHSIVCSSLGEMPSFPCNNWAILVACLADATKATMDQAQYAAKSTNQKSTYDSEKQKEKTNEAKA